MKSIMWFDLVWFRCIVYPEGEGNNTRLQKYKLPIYLCTSKWLYEREREREREREKEII